MKNIRSDTRVMVIAPNNCSPDYRITKSVEMISKITPNVTFVRMVDFNKDLHKIEMANDIHAQGYGKSLKILSELKFLSHISFMFYLLLKISFFFEKIYRLIVGRIIASNIKHDRDYKKIRKKLQKFQAMIADSQEYKDQ